MQNIQKHLLSQLAGKNPTHIKTYNAYTHTGVQIVWEPPLAVMTGTGLGVCNWYSF
jgi:hypothetical protein